jgi:hypothetical protein
MRVTFQEICPAMPFTYDLNPMLATHAKTAAQPNPALLSRVRALSFFAVYLALVLCLLLPASLLAQSDLGSITGSVSDPSGALVANATVTATNESTGANRTVTTNRSGFYSMPALAPGKYTLTVQAQGFDKLIKISNNVDPSLPNTENLQLTVGQVSQAVQVEADQTTLETQSATLGRVITSNQIANLPLNGRNPIYAALTKAGITSAPTSPTGANGSAAASNISSFSFSTGLGALQINGSRERDNLLTYDGAVAVRVRASGDSVGTPDLDAVQEIQVLATNYPAEYGRSIGGQVRIITRSGGQSFHGSLYEYLQNPAFNANSWTRNFNANNNNPNYPANLKTNFVAPFTFNQFGGVFDGPLYIPHILPKGKVFFLYSEAFVKYPQKTTATYTTLNPAYRTGDFSSFIAPGVATPHYIRDPQSGLPCAPTTGIGGGCFQGNMIPTKRLSANGVGLMSIFPTPTPNFLLGTSNLLDVASYPASQEIDSGNLDIVPTDKDTIRFRLIHFYYHEDSPFNSAYGIVPRLYQRPNQTGSLDWVHTFTANTTNEVFLSASHDAARLSIDTSSGLYDRTKYGINYPFLFPGTKDLPNKIPTVKFDSTSTITAVDGSPYPSHSQGEIFDFADTFTHILGNHVIRAGALYERSGENDDDQIAFSNSTAGQTNNQNGQFDFNSGNPNGTSLDLADAALGLYYTYAEVGARDETPYRANLYEFFAQDSFQATPKLHLEYGLRYSIIQPYYSLWNNAGSFDPAFYSASTAVQVNATTGNPVANSGDPLDGTVLWGNGFTASSKGHINPSLSAYSNLFHNLPRGYIHVQKFLFQPRVGIAYAVNAKTVIRSGFGRYTNRQGVSDFVFAGGIPPLQQVVSVSTGTADNPASGSTGSYPTLSGDIDQRSPQPEAYIYNLSVERQLPLGVIADASYVGRRALHQQYAANINQLPAGTLTANPGVAANALRPFKGYGAINYVAQGDGAFYQGFQVDVNRRFTHGLGVGVAYTLAHATDCDSYQKTLIPNTYDPKSYCGTSDYDVKQVLVLNSVYAIPFHSGSSLLNEALAGWQLSQAYQFQSGPPLSVTTGNDIAGVGPGSGPQFLNVTPGANLKGNGHFSKGADGNSWFNTKNPDGTLIFTLPTAGTFTSEHVRNILRAPGQAYFNASIQKKFTIYHEQKLSFRFDAFDFPNHPNWNAPDTNFSGETITGTPAYTDATFGKVTQKNNQRSMQASLRYSF